MVLFILSALLNRVVPTGIFIFRRVEVTESINLCEYTEDENSKQANKKIAEERRINFYLKINLPVVLKQGNRTKVCYRL